MILGFGIELSNVYYKRTRKVALMCENPLCNEYKVQFMPYSSSLNTIIAFPFLPADAKNNIKAIHEALMNGRFNYFMLFSLS